MPIFIHLLRIYIRFAFDSIFYIIYCYYAKFRSAGEVQYSTVRYGTVQYSTVQYSTVQYSTVQCSAVQQCSEVQCVLCCSCCPRRWLCMDATNGRTRDFEQLRSGMQANARTVRLSLDRLQWRRSTTEPRRTESFGTEHLRYF